jgi:hypothetical protein
MCPKGLRAALIGSLLLIACQAAAAFATDASPNVDRLIVPGKRAGPITSKTTRTDLARFFGAKNVHDADIMGSDGGHEAGTVVFADEPNASLGILWLDESPDARVRSIVFCQASEPAEACRWHTDDGISFGTDLKALERINGRKFRLHGFDWGYGGLISSWDGGRLERLSAECGRVTLRVDPAPGPATDERSALIAQVEGDGEFWSSDAPMQALNPRVDHISMSFQGCKQVFDR